MGRLIVNQSLSSRSDTVSNLSRHLTEAAVRAAKMRTRIRIISPASALLVGMVALLPSAMADGGVTPLGPLETVFTKLGSKTPAIASDASGNFVVAAVCPDASGNGNSAICAQLFHADGTPSGNSFFAVNNGSFITTDTTAVAMTAEGAFAVAWTDDSGAGTRSHVQRFAADGSPMGPQLGLSKSAYSVPSLAMDGSGNIAVVWETHREFGFPYVFSASTTSIYTQVYSSSNTPSGPARLLDSGFEYFPGKYSQNQPSGSALGSPSLAMDSSGELAVAWTHINVADGTGQLFAQRYAATGTPRGVRVTVNTFSASASAPYGVRVAMSASGDFTASWDDAFSGDIMFRQFNGSGAAKGAAQTVASKPSGSPSDSDLAMDAQGNFIITWIGGPASVTSGIYARRYDLNGQPFGAAFLIDDVPIASECRVTMTPSGSNLALAWIAWNGGDSSIQAQSFSVP